MHKKAARNAVKRTNAERAFDIVNTVLMVLVALLCFYPIYFTVIASFSDPTSVVTGKVLLYPKRITLDSYKEILKYASILNGYKNTLIYTSCGTLYNLLLLIPAAYALSKKVLKGRKLLMAYFIFTMYFNGGLIPYFLQLKKLGMLNTMWVLIIPSALNVYNLIITRTFFESSIPDTLCEAAKIDGAGEFRIFVQIALPLSGAIVAVMALYHAVAHWNSYFSALLFINKPELYPLQLVMRQILMTTQFQNEEMMSGLMVEEMVRRKYVAETLKYALVILANLPIFVVYPFVQKYFVKGVMIGAIK